MVIYKAEGEKKCPFFLNFIAKSPDYFEIMCQPLYERAHCSKLRLSRCSFCESLETIQLSEVKHNDVWRTAFTGGKVCRMVCESSLRTVELSSDRETRSEF